MGLAFVAAYFVPREYRADVRVAPAPAIEDSESGGLAKTLGGLTGVGSLFAGDARFAVDLESIRSYEVVARLERDSLMMRELFPDPPTPGPDPTRRGLPASTWDTLREFRKRASVTFDARYGIAEAGFCARDPERAATLLGTWLREADAMLRERKLAETAGRIEQLELELAGARQIDVAQALEGHLVSELRRQALVKAARGVSFILVETPVPPDVPVYPRPKLTALIVGLLYGAFRFVILVLLGRGLTAARAELAMLSRGLVSWSAEAHAVEAAKALLFLSLLLLPLMAVAAPKGIIAADLCLLTGWGSLIVAARTRSLKLGLPVWAWWMLGLLVPYLTAMMLGPDRLFAPLYPLSLIQHLYAPFFALLLVLGVQVLWAEGALTILLRGLALSGLAVVIMDLAIVALAATGMYVFAPAFRSGVLDSRLVWPFAQPSQLPGFLLFTFPPLGPLAL